jgi:hypothetical protein
MSFRDYLLHGWKLCSIPPGTKGPRTKGWNTRENAIAAPALGPALAGAGLCHAWSGTAAIDVDDYEEARGWLLSRGIDLDALLTDPAAVRIESGREGRAKLLYAHPAPLASLKLAPYTREKKHFHALEFRCASAEGLTVQDVLPPTIHPTTGQPYEWAYGNELIGHWSNLPALPASLLALWTLELAPIVTSGFGPVAPIGAAPAEIQELLDAQDPDTDYDTWLKVGMALHHETQGSNEGLTFWDAWSAKGSKYKGRADLDPHWRSFKRDATNPVTLGSLRSETIAALEAFPVIAAASNTAEPDYGEDTRLDATMQRAVGDHVVYVRDADLYFDKRQRRLYPSKDALRNDFMPIIPLIEIGDKWKKPDPIAWLMNSEQRRKTDVEAVGMHPGAGVIFEEAGRRFANGYRAPPEVTALAPKPHEREAFEFIWTRMEDVTFRRWLKKFYAHALKYPGVKIRSAPLLISETTGTGKSLLMSLIPTLLFGRVAQMTESQLRTQFNGELINAWWVTFEEVYAGNTKSERRFVTEKVKTWLTNDDLPINAKNLTAFTMRNRLQFTASSNHLDALQLEDDEERRWGVCHVAEKAYTERERLDAVIGFLLTPRAPGVLKHIFQQEDLTGFQKDGAPPATHAKRAMVRAGIGTWESALIERIIGGEAPFDRDVFKLRDVYDQLMGRGPISMHAMSAILRRKPFHAELLRSSSKARLWAWRNVEQWQRRTEGERLRYLETGGRPLNDTWSDEVPTMLRMMGADEAESPTGPCDDLIG